MVVIEGVERGGGAVLDPVVPVVVVVPEVDPVVPVFADAFACFFTQDSQRFWLENFGLE